MPSNQDAARTSPLKYGQLWVNRALDGFEVNPYDGSFLNAFVTRFR
jgi:hypothetical protein